MLATTITGSRYATSTTSPPRRDHFQSAFLPGFDGALQQGIEVVVATGRVVVEQRRRRTPASAASQTA
jgi:hypothetical protein